MVRHSSSNRHRGSIYIVGYTSSRHIYVWGSWGIVGVHDLQGMTDEVQNDPGAPGSEKRKPIRSIKRTHARGNNQVLLRRSKPRLPLVMVKVKQQGLKWEMVS